MAPPFACHCTVAALHFFPLCVDICLIYLDIYLLSVYSSRILACNVLTCSIFYKLVVSSHNASVQFV